MGIMQLPVKSSAPLITTIISPTLNTDPAMKAVKPFPK